VAPQRMAADGGSGDFDAAADGHASARQLIYNGTAGKGEGSDASSGELATHTACDLEVRSEDPSADGAAASTSQHRDTAQPGEGAAPAAAAPAMEDLLLQQIASLDTVCCALSQCIVTTSTTAFAAARHPQPLGDARTYHLWLCHTISDAYP
jgi:hypothetical protein